MSRPFIDFHVFGLLAQPETEKGWMTRSSLQNWTRCTSLRQANVQELRDSHYPLQVAHVRRRRKAGRCKSGQPLPKKLKRPPIALNLVLCRRPIAASRGPIVHLTVGWEINVKIARTGSVNKYAVVMSMWMALKVPPLASRQRRAYNDSMGVVTTNYSGQLDVLLCSPRGGLVGFVRRNPNTVWPGPRASLAATFLPETFHVEATRLLAVLVRTSGSPARSSQYIDSPGHAKCTMSMTHSKSRLH